jgi:hypothetical protein
MSARKSALTLPLPLQFLAAWLAVWLGRALQEQVEYLKAENLLLRGNPLLSRNPSPRVMQLSDGNSFHFPLRTPFDEAFTRIDGSQVTAKLSVCRLSTTYERLVPA